MESTQTVNAGSCDTFTLFPKLPPELRLKIWKIAASVPRAITIRSTEYFYGQKYRIDSRRKLQSLMCVNREAREAGAAISQCRQFSFTRMGKSAPIHFNPKKDIVFLQNFSFADVEWIQGSFYDYSSFRDDLKFVENLALCGRTHLYLRSQDLTDFFKLLPSLKTLVVYRSEATRERQQMMMLRSGRVGNWVSGRRCRHSFIQNQLQGCWETLKSVDPNFQAPAVTFMELGDIEALKSSPENWPMSR